jgi:TPR repeat protein
MKTAMRSYLTVAHMGHGLADLRLGQLYDWDPSGKVPHDLRESLFFYREARKRGITIEGPIPMRKDFGPS